MRIITKDIQLPIGGSPQSVRLTKPDAFSGVEILRLLLRLQGEPPATAGGGCFAGGEVNRNKRWRVRCARRHTVRGARA